MSLRFFSLSNACFVGIRVTKSTTANRFRSSHAPIHQRFPIYPLHKRRLIAASGFVLVSSIAVFASSRSGIHADEPSTTDENKPQVTRPVVPLSSLFRSYLVYTMCSVPMLIDWSPSILSVLSSIPGVKHVTELFVRYTFFLQFVGGDTAQKCIPLIKQLRAENKGCLFAYSIEVDESQLAGPSTSKSGHAPVHKRIVQEMIRSIDVAADFEDKLSSSTGRKTWVAIKMTALVPDSQSLVKLSKYLLRSRSELPTPIPFPGCPAASDLAILDLPDVPVEFTPTDVTALKELRDDLFRICARAKERGVRIIIDAEYSWYQPAIDAYTLALVRRFNKLIPCESASKIQPLVYSTYQAYLRRTPTHLEQSIRDAQAGNYSIGVKLVRGAYHEHEIAAHSSTSSISPSISSESDPPVFFAKAETDECYDSCAKFLIKNVKRDILDTNNVPHIGILFGTHNHSSCKTVLDELVKEGLATEDKQDGVLNLGDNVLERLTFGQLLGMKDDLTEYLVSKTKSRNPIVLKYVPYGAVSEVMPYLSRRAIENKSVLGNGGAVEERRRVGTEIRRRILGF